ncbi:leucyl/phenylalanyl-tRNA--protein transferase [Duganella sp. 3397]|uniref:Leucyl/phenylalanyl-tRNA--protein transferase n=1 Tax=Duganella phyllosphaerae TaxID=762836 RepID=A0A1E7WH86_9BURK|nr:MULTISPECIES: leucyl/phenylalanyl-tRNA--protein transferase [Duganella]MDR7051628.1 leucyl/phenylalanyl-tRNA--protein transferase [Duganella sp. 3397]OEZ97999.1 leucyl/phenylalanyl-tRNA--protein transferase [Duganella phyllosphaerae]
MIPWLERDTPFPDVSTALTREAPGLLAAGADLSPQRLLMAYRHGIFPWFSEGQPILWWSTDPRMVLMTDQFRISDSLRKTLRKVERERTKPDGGRWQVRFDSAFEDVMRACAAPRRDGPGTWISDDIIAGYTGLHSMGYAHSAEVWLDGALVGGAYGVSIGRMFYGESMFARVTDGSKIALAYLVRFLREQGVQMIDCQQETSHLASLGAIPVTRARFLSHLRNTIELPQIMKWEPIAPWSQER